MLKGNKVFSNKDANKTFGTVKISYIAKNTLPGLNFLAG
jgi:hypothetical protein